MSPGSFAIFEDTKHNKRFYFQNPIAQISTHDPAQIKECFQQIEDWRQQGFYVVGHVCYEAGFSFYPTTDKIFFNPKTPLIHFLVFKEKNLGTPSFLKNMEPEADLTLFDCKTEVTEQDYKFQQEQIHRSLLDGEYYQLNQTFQKSFRCTSDSLSLYEQLKKNQKTSYTCFIRYSDYEVLSFSPELFYKKQGGLVLTEPMKGTLSAELPSEHLLNDEKQIAENLMIVDLLRNDLGKLAKPGTVHVEELFKIQTLETVHQMTSKISAQIEPSTTIFDLFSNLFPCGSITGAPKWRTMQAIAKLETQPRGVYTGAIGFVEPNNDQCFSVAIRTLTHREERYHLGVGGGIVTDSLADQEWQEAQLKGQFLRKINHSFFLFETLLFDGKIFKNESQHLNRLCQSASFFDFSIERSQITNKLLLLKEKILGQPSKIKIKLFYNGDMKIECEVVDHHPSPKQITLSSQRIDSTNVFQLHKTSRRDLYDKEWQRAVAEKFYDVFFLNEKDNVAEASRHNIFVRRNGKWLTPPLSSGALPGIERHNAIKDFNAVEQELRLEDLKSAEEILLTNSLRGRVSVTWSLT